MQALNVIVERAVVVLVLLNQAKGVAVAKVLKLDQARPAIAATIMKSLQRGISKHTTQPLLA